MLAVIITLFSFRTGYTKVKKQKEIVFILLVNNIKHTLHIISTFVIIMFSLLLSSLYNFLH